jgi:hypothetical protein
MVMTNKQRKRAPGGGRKPQGPFSNKFATLSTRITGELRESLDRETARSREARAPRPWSLSQEIEQRLRDSIDMPAKLHKAWGPEHIKDLAQLVSRVARSVEFAVGANPSADDAGNLAWHKNQYTHAAVTAAINTILAHTKPSEPAQTPPEVKKRAEWIKRESGKEEFERQCTPESVGLSCALGLLDRLASPGFPPMNHPANEYYAEGYSVFPNIRKILSKEQKK